MKNFIKLCLCPLRARGGGGQGQFLLRVPYIDYLSQSVEESGPGTLKRHEDLGNIINTVSIITDIFTQVIQYITEFDMTLHNVLYTVNCTMKIQVCSTC